MFVGLGIESSEIDTNLFLESPMKILIGTNETC